MKTLVSVCDVCKGREEFSENDYAVEHVERTIVLWENRKRVTGLDVCDSCFQLIFEACKMVLAGEVTEKLAKAILAISENGATGDPVEANALPARVSEEDEKDEGKEGEGVDDGPNENL
jgi:hypothetical protein